MLVGALAIGFSAFTTAKSHKKQTASVFYILSSSNQYTKFTGSGQPSEAGCEDAATHRCVIGYDSDQGSTLNASSLPSTPTYQSDSNGLWENP